MEQIVKNMTGTVKKTINEREKLGLLASQMAEMGSDYEDMRKAREEAKRQLEAKFQDVYRQIKDTRDFVTQEGKRVNEVLKNFQLKFDSELGELKQYTIDSFEKERQDRETAEAEANAKMDDLERQIEEERQERQKQTEDILNPVRKSLAWLEKAYEKEKNTRIQKEEEIMERLEEDCKKMNDKMDEEKINRIVKMAELKDTLYQDMKIQNDHIDSFQQHTREALTDMKNGIVEELRSRLDHQDEMLDNLSKFIGTFQSTLKIIGKDI